MRRFHIPFGLKLFALVWIVVVLLPPFRECFRGQQLQQSISEGRMTINIDRAALARRFPNDPKVLAEQIPYSHFQDPEVFRPSIALNKQLADYDALIQRFPRENWLRAQRLNFMMRYAIDIKSSGKRRRETGHVLERAQLVKAIPCVLDAEKIEPENAYFPWVEAVLRFALSQDDDGIKALRKAAKGTRFTDYLPQQSRDTLAIGFLDHRLLFEDKLMVLFGVLVPAPEKISQASTYALTLAASARSRGDDRLALEIIDAVLGAGLVFKEKGDNRLDQVLGRYILRSALENSFDLKPLRTTRYSEMTQPQRDSYLLALAQMLNAYARRNHRDDTARLGFVAAKAASQPYDRFGLNTQFWNFFGLGDPWGRIAFQGNWFLIQIAKLVFAFAGFWLGVQAILWVRVRRDETVGSRGLPGRGQVTSSATFAAWALLGLGALIARFGVGFMVGEVAFVTSLDMETNRFISGLLSQYWACLALFAWLLPIGWLVLMRNSIWTRPAGSSGSKVRPLSSKMNWMRRGLWLLALFTGTLSYSNGRGLWDDTIFQSLTSPILFGGTLAGAVGFEIYRIIRSGRLSPGKLQKRPLPDRTLFALRLTGSSAGALAVICSFYYLAGALTLWPLRATMNHAIERRIQIGEMKWEEEEKARHPEWNLD